jgi:hypothetical protein
LILDRDALKWFKPTKGQFYIYYKDGANHLEYQPDFIAEVTDAIYMLEPKASNEMGDPAVLAKKEAAVQWCRHALRTPLTTRKALFFLNINAGARSAKSGRIITHPHGIRQKSGKDFFISRALPSSPFTFLRVRILTSLAEVEIGSSGGCKARL